MADKNNKNKIAQLKEEIEASKAMNAELARTLRTYEKLVLAGKDLTKEQKEFAKNARASLADEEKKKKLLEQYKKQLSDSLDMSVELNDSMASLSSTMGKLPGVAKGIGKSFDQTKEKLSIITDILKDATDTTESQKDIAVAASKAYANITITVSDMAKQLAKGTANQEEYNKAVSEAYKNFEELTDRIDGSTESGKKLKDQFESAKKSQQGFADAAEASSKSLATLNTALDEFGGSGIPAARELSSFMQNLANKDIPAAKAAFVALGAVIGKLAADYFAAPWQVDIEFRNERIENQINALKQMGEAQVDTQARGSGTMAVSAFPTDRGGAPQMKKVIGDVGKQLGKTTEQVSMRDLFLAKEKGQIQLDTDKQIAELQIERGAVGTRIENELAQTRISNQESLLRAQIDAGFAAARAAAAFSAQVATAAAQFRAMSKTALFGDKLGGVGYGAAKLQMAGISADKIAGAMSDAAAATGKMPTGKVAADMAILAERTGMSTEGIASINEAFQRMDGVSENVALNLQEGMRALADNAGISLGNLMKEVADASKEALGYQIKSAKELAKQVAYTQSIGVNFGDVAKAGKSMVLNYKDSIKAEMQLSTLLGEQVDLSEVRAKFAEGDTAGALEALKAQGLDPSQMDMFQQQALQEALGGMDLSSLQKIATKTGKTAELGQGKAGAANQGFLDRKMAAEATLNAEQAQISAKQAIIEAGISAAASEAFLNSPTYKKLQEQKIDQEIKAAQDEANIKKAIAEKLASDEFLTAEERQKMLGITYDSAKANLLTFNENVKAAAAALKQLGMEKSLTENIIGTIGGVLGGVLTNTLTNVIENKIGKTKLGGANSSFADKRRMVAERQRQRATGGAGGPKPKGKGFKLGKGGKAAALMAVGSFLLPTIASAMSGGGSDESTGEVLTPETIEPTTQMEMGGSSDICACIGALQSGLNPLQSIEDSLYTTEQYHKESLPYLKEGLATSVNDTLKFEAMELAISKGGQKLTSTFSKKVGTELVEVAGKGMAKSLGANLAQTAGKSMATKFAASMGGKLMTKALGGGPLGVVTGLVGGAAEMFGDYKKQQALATGDTSALQVGRASSTAGTTLSYAGIGATIGSLIPGIGTAVGGAVGGAIGFVKGLWDNYFSEEAQREAAEVQRQKENQEALQSIITLDKSISATFERDAQAASRMADIADDEPAWREATLAQLVEMTRLTEMILFKGEGDKVTVGGKQIGREYEGASDKTKQVQARRLGKAEALTERERNIAGVMQQGGYKNMNVAEYQKAYNVTNDEIAKILEKQKLLAIASETQQKKVLEQTQKGSTPGAPAPGGKPVTGGAPTPGGAPVPGGAPIPAGGLSTEATLKLIQTQADVRGIVIAGKMDLLNTTLSNIQIQADARGIIMAGKLDALNLVATSIQSQMTALKTNNGSDGIDKVGSGIDKVGNLTSGLNARTEKLITRNDKIANFSMDSAKKLGESNTNLKEMVRINKNLQSILMAVLTNNQNSGNIQLQIDGKPVMRMIQKRAADAQGQGDNTGGGGTSDIRLKTDIKQIGVSKNGITIYEFKYVWDSETLYQGVMAQELIGTEFENAVIENGVEYNGKSYYAVDYSLIDVEFKKIN
jgi:hypothetical protein